MPYDFYNALPENEEKLREAGVPISGSLEDLVSKCDIMLDASPAGIGAKTMMHLMPHIDVTGILIHTPVTHGHIITAVVTMDKSLSKESFLDIMGQHPRIHTVKIADGFLGNASLFRYARDMGKFRGDNYEIALWDESVVMSGNQVMFAIHIPQESVVIPENMNAIRAAMNMQPTRETGTAETNRYLGIGTWMRRTEMRI